MIIQNFKFAGRNLLKNKAVTMINILGLTIGIMVSLLIFAYVRKEITTDQQLPDHEKIYALLCDGDPCVSKRMVDLVKQETPEIEKITYCDYEWSPQVFLEKDHTDFKINKLLVADSSFFRVFQFEPLWGDPATALNRAGKIVLSESLSEKIFGDENPVGKQIIYNSTDLQNEMLEVGAVIKDFSQYSSWEFEAVLSIETNTKMDWYANLLKSWGTQNYTGFFRINDKTDPVSLQEKLAAVTTADLPERYRGRMHFGLIPFNRAYFDLPDIDELRHGNYLTVSVIRIIGLLILLLACVNYINMVTAQREKRLRSIGIVKTLGSTRQKVIALITTESLVVLLITLSLLFMLSPAGLAGLNYLTGSGFTFQSLFSGWNLLILTGIFAFTLAVTGLLPGYLFSRYKTTLLLKNQTGNVRGTCLRNSLMIFQFSISIALIAGVLLIGRQNGYLQKYSPGFAKEQIIFANTNPDIDANIQSFKNELRQIPGITDLAFSSEPLGYIEQNWGIDLINKGERQEIGFANFWVSPNFFDFFGIEFKRGGTFNSNSDETDDFIFNEYAIDKFQIDQFSDARVKIDDNPEHGRIIGEIRNFNFESMHMPVRAAGFMSSGDVDEVAYFKVSAVHGPAFDQTIRSVERVWKSLSPHFPFEFKFLDASWDALCRKEVQFQKILSCATAISLFLSCLGLIGLTFFAMENRTKEIGIRKVNGAKISEILAMLNKDFIKWVVIAFVIATPVAYYVMNKWLENFAYKTNLSWWIFAVAGLLALGIALLTVSWQSWKAATRNPVEALRYE